VSPLWEEATNVNPHTLNPNPNDSKSRTFVALLMADIALQVMTKLWPFFSAELPTAPESPLYVTLVLASITTLVTTKLWPFFMKK
jgi:hypothetical protein